MAPQALALQVLALQALALQALAPQALPLHWRWHCRHWHCRHWHWQCLQSLRIRGAVGGPLALPLSCAAWPAFQVRGAWRGMAILICAPLPKGEKEMGKAGASSRGTPSTWTRTRLARRLTPSGNNSGA